MKTLKNTFESLGDFLGVIAIVCLISLVSIVVLTLRGSNSFLLLGIILFFIVSSVLLCSYTFSLGFRVVAQGLPPDHDASSDEKKHILRRRARITLSPRSALVIILILSFIFFALNIVTEGILLSFLVTLAFMLPFVPTIMLLLLVSFIRIDFSKSSKLQKSQETPE